MNGPCTKGQTFLSLYWNKKVGHTWAICGPQMGHKKAKLVNTILAHLIKYGAPGAIRTRDLASETENYDVHVHHPNCINILCISLTTDYYKFFCS